jgi:cardiolipin synthase
MMSLRTPHAHAPASPPRLYFDGPTYFAALIRAIDHARRSVDLETYIFDLDETGQSVVDALVRAARRGTRVRVLVDGVGSWRTLSVLAAAFAATPVQFKVFRRMGLRSAWANFRVIRELGHRNHRKTCLIDESSAWIGSFNISAVHTRGSLRTPSWRDSAIQVRSKDLCALYEAFDRAWGDPGRRPRPFP